VSGLPRHNGACTIHGWLSIPWLPLQGSKSEKENISIEYAWLIKTLLATLMISLKVHMAMLPFGTISRSIKALFFFSAP
jgi:hypothetical protein